MKAATAPKKTKPAFCSAAKIAAVMGVSRPTPLNWHQRGQIPGVQIGQIVRFPIKETAKRLGIDESLLTD
jgi:excisionase family DNA binding protein